MVNSMVSCEEDPNCCTPFIVDANFMKSLNRTFDKVYCQLTKYNVRLAKKMSVCENGNLVEDHYCGRGNCDLNGCNCDGGCIKFTDIEDNNNPLCPEIIQNRDNYMEHFQRCSVTKITNTSVKNYVYDCPPSCEETLHKLRDLVMARDASAAVTVKTIPKTPKGGFDGVVRWLLDHITGQEYLKVINACPTVQVSTILNF